MMTRVSSTFAIITVIINSFCSSIHAHSGGFSVDLIHRDSSSSPFYNPGETPSQRARNVAGRSLGRVARFTNMVRVDSYSSLAPSSHVNDDVVAPLVLDSDGEYLMNISLGSPSLSILATADTASDITWMLCQPCTNCYEQDAPGNNVVSTPLFSSTQLPTFFYLLQLDFVSVGATIIPFTGASSRGSLENIIIDMGVPYTVVPTDFLSEFTTAFEALAIGGNKTNDPEGGGADLRLTPVNVLIPVSDTVSCLAFLGNDDISIYGSSAQKDFLVGFDLVDRTVSFKPTDCAMN
ncbi:Aspartic proteinase CDR1 [Linum perenne]